ncbi:MAG: hypothetical protein A2057_15280 [Ignavibacteria bacterium GWA2_35_9]|nr:MAG: hypothetical protein A2057_15280 [Ignavibacteria bacterium GWA2_35_9]OGU47231.1 MAG: hypothetical protein A2000_00860 [Ignavibacteria bacterium GWB2_36_8]OGU50113.1 MAG: hypothetical protein A2080_11835 [Ignavibacteria bacterium GWC2_36_12]OGV09828.1 MAG: hypothetical protein A3J84_06335 [Ignavibacteria bacterium RIFOXYA2_FULL_37_17]OGV11724.1 MAG: hypothetical protein A2330_05095 [Ignavibacteria bacterium RIFOXYB2_FULL_36_7]
MIKKIYLVFFVLIIFNSYSYSQMEISTGVYTGGGIISANSPGQTAFTSSVFVDAYLNPEDYLSARLSFIFATDFNSLIPESRNQYYPFIKGLSLKGVYTYYFTTNIFMEQGLGGLLLNDRIYIDRNNWDFGVIFSLLGGVDLRKEEYNGFKIGIGTEYGMTFMNYSIQYFSIHFQGQYVF